MCATGCATCWLSCPTSFSGPLTSDCTRRGRVSVLRPRRVCTFCVGLQTAFSWLMERKGIMLIQFTTGPLGQLLHRWMSVCVCPQRDVFAWLIVVACSTKCDAGADGRASENISRPLFCPLCPKANMAESLTLIPFFKALSKLHLRAARGGGGDVWL